MPARELFGRAKSRAGLEHGHGHITTAATAVKMTLTYVVRPREDCGLRTVHGESGGKGGGRKSGGCQEDGDGLGGGGGCNGFVAGAGSQGNKSRNWKLDGREKKKETIPDGVTHVLSP